MTNKTFSKRIQESLDLTKSTSRWEQLIVTLLRRLELDQAAREDAEREYNALADRVAERLDLPRHSVDVIPQGSMRTQTTIRPPGRSNFDLDVVFVLSGPLYVNCDPEQFFQDLVRRSMATKRSPECLRPRIVAGVCRFRVSPFILM